MKHKDPPPPSSQASLVAHMVKNLPAMQETWVQSLGQEDPLKKEWVPILVFLPGEFHGLSPWGHSYLNYEVECVRHSRVKPETPARGRQDVTEHTGGKSLLRAGFNIMSSIPSLLTTLLFLDHLSHCCHSAFAFTVPSPQCFSPRHPHSSLLIYFRSSFQLCLP